MMTMNCRTYFLFIGKMIIRLLFFNGKDLNHFKLLKSEATRPGGSIVAYKVNW